MAVPQEYKKVIPVSERVLVKVDNTDATTSGGIVLPTTAQKAPNRGEVVSSFQGGAVQSGDQVVYGNYAGTAISLQGKDHVLLKEEDVVGIMKSSSVRELQPVGGRILVEVSDVEETTSGGVLLTTATQEQPTFGQVLAVGPGKSDDDGSLVKPNVTPGSTILYSKYSGVEFEGEDAKKYIVIREEDVLAELT